MNINEYGAVFLSEVELFDLIYSGKISNFNNLYLENADAIDKFNSAIKENADSFNRISKYQQPEESIEFFDEANQCEWFMPNEYQTFPLEQWLLNKCQSDVERTRVQKELELFIQHDMFDLLFYLKYLVDTMREHEILWGVGRGSSVASYVLYLIGVHKINSIKYDLDIKEFLK